MREVLTRSRIVDAARQVMITKGLHKVSLRRIAAELDVTAPALYAHIADKDDLLSAIGDIEFEELRARTAPPAGATPLEAIEATIRGYVQFSIDRPNAFQLLFRPLPVDKHPSSGTRVQQTLELFEQTIGAIQEAVDEGSFRAVDPHLTGFTLWSVAHGISRGIQFGFETDDPEKLVSSVVETLAAGLTKD